MIVADSSALVAIHFGEDACARFIEIIKQADQVAVSAFTIYEASVVVLMRLGKDSLNEFRQLPKKLQLQLHPFTPASFEAALAAYQRFGKGLGGRPYLNLGDCVSYALAVSLSAPLLYKGDDFSVTGVASCV